MHERIRRNLCRARSTGWAHPPRGGRRPRPRGALGFYRDMLGLSSRRSCPSRPIGSRSPSCRRRIEDRARRADRRHHGVARFLAAKGEGFHHVCFEVPDVADTLTGSPSRDRADRHGAAQGGRGPGRLPPSAVLPRRPRRAHRGAGRPGLDGAGL